MQALVVVVLFLICVVLATPKFPLHTQSRWIVDSNGQRVKLACVNWYGAHMRQWTVNGLDAQPLDTIAASIRRMGFNCVRLPFSLELIYSNPIVSNTSTLAANPNLIGQTGMQIFDATVEALAKNDLMIILNNHVSTAKWCCSLDDGEGLWYTNEYSEQQFVQAWQGLAKRYSSNPYVVGADLRNELRAAHGVSPTWGTGDVKTDWAAAATRCGNAVLEIQPTWLIIVEGLNYATDLRAAYSHPITLSVANRLVYSAHDYSWSFPAVTYDEYQTIMGDQWGYLVTQNRPFTAPVWVGEFGTGDQSNWWSWVRQYLANADFDWAYWAVDGEKSLGEDESFGIFSQDYQTVRSPWKLTDLQAIQPATQNP